MQRLILDYFYNLFSQVEMMACIYIVARFVFGRMDRTDKSSVKRMLLATVPLTLFVSALIVWNDNFYYLNIIVHILMFAMLDSKRKISDIFLYFPVLGIIMGIYMIPVCVMNVVYGSLNFVFETENVNSAQIVVEVIFILIVAITCIAFYRLNKKYPLYFTTDKRKKSTVFYTVMGYGYLVVMIAQVVVELVYNNRLPAFGILVILFIMDLAMVIMLVQEYRVKYFVQIAALNEYYLNSQVEQFRNYRIQQHETRRIRHDMQNHLLMLGQLAENGDLHGIKDYISGLSEEMQLTSSELRTGNDTADAIVNAKYSQAARLGIKIEINGMFPPDMDIAAIDVCTIFANALDNAIEGIPQDCAGKNKVITIGVSNSNSMHMVTFRNPAKPIAGSTFITNKEDKINHGFGMENMRRAAEKYNGRLSNRIECEGETCYFVLEAVIFC